MVERARHERRHPDAGAVRAGEVEQALGRAALVLVDPAVGDGPAGRQAERHRDVAGHRVGVDQQHVPVLAVLDDRREVRRDRRLADPALRIEDGEDRRAGGPLGLDRPVGEDRRCRPAGRTLGADDHGLDAPAEPSAETGRRTISSSGRGRPRRRGHRGLVGDDEDGTDGPAGPHRRQEIAAKAAGSAVDVEDRQPDRAGRPR